MSKIEQFMGLTDETATNFGSNKEPKKKSTPKDKLTDTDKTELVLNSLGLGKNKLGRKKTTVSMSMDTYNKLITLSVESGETISDIVEKVLDKSLKNVEVNKDYVEAFNTTGTSKRRNRVKLQ